MTLYEIDQRITSLIDQETGELLDYEAFIQLEMDREKKIEGAVLWYKELVAQAKMIKDEIEALTKRQKAAQRRADGLVGWINLALNGERFSTARCSVSFRKSASLQVCELSAAAFWLEKNGYHNMVVYAEPKLDKRAVSALIKQGIEVPGVELVERKSVQVR